VEKKVTRVSLYFVEFNVKVHSLQH